MNSVHDCPDTQPAPFVLQPVKKVLHSSSVKPFLSLQILALHLFVVVSQPHLPTPSFVVEAATHIDWVLYDEHNEIVKHPAPDVVQVSAKS